MDGHRGTNKAAWVFMFLAIHKFYQVSLRNGSIFSWISTIHCLPLLPHCLSQLSSNLKGCVGARLRWLGSVRVGVSFRGETGPISCPEPINPAEASASKKQLCIEEIKVAVQMICKFQFNCMFPIGWYVNSGEFYGQSNWQLIALGAALMRKSQSLPRIPGTDIKLDDSEGDDCYYNVAIIGN